MPVAIKQTATELTAILQPDDGGYLAVCPELDVLASGDDREDAFGQLLEAVRDYAEEYLEHLAVYRASPNRGPHLEYVNAVAAAPDRASLRRLFTL